MSDAPAVMYQYRCKICTLANTHPDLFKDLHIQVLEVGSSLNRAMNYINHRIEQEGLDVTPYNNQNMSVHFNSHITLPDKVNHELSKVSPTAPSLKDHNPQVGSFVEDIIRRKVGNEVNDYLNLDSLRAQLLDKLELLDGIVEKEQSDGSKVVDMDAMAHYTTLAKEIRACIVDLHKVRQSKQLMHTMIQSLIRKSTFETVRQLSREYDQVKQDLTEAGVDQNIITKTDQQLRVRLAEVVATTARDAIADVVRMYKL
jgi:hypothetical protein